MIILNNSQLKSLCYFFFWTLIFNFSFVQLPLYSSNQNTYFLHGLANAGFGYLKEDWLANTVDSFPVFNTVVSLTYKVLNEYFFYFYNLILSGIYLHGLVGIVSKVYDIKSSIQKTFIYVIVITFHNKGFIYIIYKFSHIWLWSGVAEQSMISGFLQPSTFAVLLIISIYAFLNERYFIAVILLNTTVAFHFSYFLSATVLALSYSFIVLKEGGYKSKINAIKAVIIFLSLSLPFLIYVLITFRPTSPEAWNQYQDILVNFRFPHHAKPESWIKQDYYFKILLVAIALYLIRKNRLFWIILISYITAIGLTITQIFSGSNTLALMFPWRISVYLIPISNSIIISFLVLQIFKNQLINGFLSKKLLVGFNLLIIAGIIVFGSIFMMKYHLPNDSIPLMNFVKQNQSPGQIFLIPPKPIEKFRLYTGIPIFVDFKSHPYKDIEVIEWFNRITIANNFFEKSDYTQQDCDFLNKIHRDYGITHVVNYSDKQLGQVCHNLNILYGDKKYEIYRIIDNKSS